VRSSALDYEHNGVVPEGLSASEVGKEIAEHREQAKGHQTEQKDAPDKHADRDHLISIVEAIMLSLVAVLAAWSGYSAAKWGTKSSVSLAKASATRTKANRADIEALQIRTLDSVSFNAVFTALTSHDPKLFRIAVARLRPGYRVAFDAWLKTDPLTNPKAPPGPSYMPQYVIPQQTQANALDAQADAVFAEGESAGSTSDKYIRITVFLATVLFIVGISSHFPLRAARYGMIAVGTILLIVSLIQLLSLPGPPA
jgi:hypothetical protein